MVVEEAEREARRWHDWWRLGFGGFLALTFVVGVYLSVWTGQPAQVPDVVVQPGEPQDPDAPEAAAPADEAEPAREPDTEPTEEPTEDPTEDPTELIAAADDPEGTTVQVLDAGGGGAAARRVAQALEDLGYNVVNVTSARGDVATTTVLSTSGSEAKAAALRARDGRFAENDRFSAGVNLHVLVGPDWR